MRRGQFSDLTPATVNGVATPLVAPLSLRVGWAFVAHPTSPERSNTSLPLLVEVGESASPYSFFERGVTMSANDIAAAFIAVVVLGGFLVFGVRVAHYVISGRYEMDNRLDKVIGR